MNFPAIWRRVISGPSPERASSTGSVVIFCTVLSVLARAALAWSGALLLVSTVAHSDRWDLAVMIADRRTISTSPSETFKVMVCRRRGYFQTAA